MPRREPFVRDLMDDGFPLSSRDYNEDISELIEDRREKLDNLPNIPNIRKRLIAAGLYVGVKKIDLAALLHLSYSQIKRISRDYP